MNIPRRAIVASTGVAALIALSRRPWLHLGATRAERRARLPGDGFITSPRLIATRAITIGAPPRDVWPWLAQMGHGRAGWYGYDLWDNAGEPSVDHVVPALQDLHEGDVIADAVGPFGFRVVEVVDGRAIVMRATIHPVTGKAADPVRHPYRPYIDFTWAFVLTPQASEQSRLIVRVRYDHSQRGWVAGMVELYEVVDAAFTRKMLAGIRDRAEGKDASLATASP